MAEYPQNGTAVPKRVWRVLFCGHVGTAAEEFSCILQPTLRMALPDDVGLLLMQEASPLRFLNRLAVADFDLVVLMFNPAISVSENACIRREYPEGSPFRESALSAIKTLPEGCDYIRAVRARTEKPIVVIQNGPLEYSAGRTGIVQAGANLVLSMPFNLGTVADELAPHLEDAGITPRPKEERHRSSESCSRPFNVVVAINESAMRDAFGMVTEVSHLLPPTLNLVALSEVEAGEIVRHPLIPPADLVVVLINNLFFDQAPSHLSHPDRHLWFIRELRARTAGSIVAMSGNWSHQELAPAREAGADHVLALPYRYSELAPALVAAHQRWAERCVRAGSGGRSIPYIQSKRNPAEPWWDGSSPTPIPIVATQATSTLRQPNLPLLSGQLRFSRPPRIVMMDDLNSVLEMLEAIMRAFFPDATILRFTNAEEAYQELLREPPDLFTTDVCHSQPDGDELLRLLSERQASFPILVMSSVVTRPDMLRPSSLGPGMNVTFLPKPFRAEELAELLRQNLVPRLVM